MSNSSCTTTGLQVHDNNANRVAVQNAADAAVAAKGQTPKVNTDLSVLGEASQPVVGPIKPVDFKTITGSYAGDHRAEAAPAVIPAQPSPRQQMEGQRDSKNYNENGKAFKSTPTGLDSESGN